MFEKEHWFSRGIIGFQERVVSIFHVNPTCVVVFSNTGTKTETLESTVYGLYVHCFLRYIICFFFSKTNIFELSIYYNHLRNKIFLTVKYFRKICSNLAIWFIIFCNIQQLFIYQEINYSNTICILCASEGPAANFIFLVFFSHRGRG